MSAALPNRPRAIGSPYANVLVFPDSVSACHHGAGLIASTIRSSVSERGKAVLGMATGGTPVPVYERLVALCRAGELSFADVSTYNLDEYYPISPFDPNSYRSYMHRNLFEHVDIAANRAHVLDGTVPDAFAAAHAAEFDRWIESEGGLDQQLLGIGRNGHIAFNEPTDLPPEQAAALPTRVIELHPVTAADAVKDFGSADLVPKRALTMGTKPILAARSILILAFGPGKADAVKRALTGPVTGALPASLLQTAAGRVTWLLDEPAAQGLA
ncbi:MAG: glucosamine-6-phosphate deaminase [Isosphaeraceae bacterium]